MLNSRLLALRTAIAAVILTLLPTAAFAQVDLPFLKDPLGGAAGGGLSTTAGQVSLEAAFTASGDGRTGRLFVTAKVSEPYHIYSLTQKPGGPKASEIRLKTSEQYRLAGNFAPDQPPAVHVYPEAWENLQVEEHAGTVSWHAPIELAAGVDPAQLRIEGSLFAMACAEGQGCLMAESMPFTAGLTSTPPISFEEVNYTAGPYQPERSHLTLSGGLSQAAVASGGTTSLTLTADPAEEWYVYALEERLAKDAISRPTLIVFENTSGLKVGQPQASGAPKSKTQEFATGPVTIQFHPEPISWRVPLEVPAGLESGVYELTGMMGFQTCQVNACDLPNAVRFRVRVPVGAARGDALPRIEFAEAKYGEVAALAEARAIAVASAPAATAKKADSESLIWMLGAALLGGLILNLMPCVLPVIGLKILTFVEQAGHDRGRVLALNLWYTAGVLIVFLGLASLAVMLNLSWGQQFTSTTFVVVLIGLIFAMALSFLGVWEIPIPGFVGSGAAAQVAAKEGPGGAFAKGVFTTVLATPCSGPFLGPVFGFLLTQPAYVTFLIFGAIGLGMSAPYLLIGAFPSLIRFLPKPGAWMDTFKQLMGFVLLGTLVYLFIVLDRDYFVPTFALLVGIWLACWWIGRTPFTAARSRKFRAWVGGPAMAALIGIAAFTFLGPREELLPWQPFTRQALAQHVAEGKTVMVDFTADWCLTCKYNLAFAINTNEVKDVVDRNDVVTLVADWSRESPEIKQTLEQLGAASIPLLAIFPANSPGQPIVLPDVISKENVVQALEQAGPSKAGNKPNEPLVARRAEEAASR